MWEQQLRGFELSSQFHARLPLVKTARHPRNNTENFQTFNKFKYLFFICHIFLGFFWGIDEVLLSSRATVYIFWSLIFNIAPDLWPWFLDPILDPDSFLVLIIDPDSWSWSLILVQCALEQFLPPHVKVDAHLGLSVGTEFTVIQKTKDLKAILSSSREFFNKVNGL